MAEELPGSGDPEQLHKEAFVAEYPTQLLYHIIGIESIVCAEFSEQIVYRFYNY